MLDLPRGFEHKVCRVRSQFDAGSQSGIDVGIGWVFVVGRGVHAALKCIPERLTLENVWPDGYNSLAKALGGIAMSMVGK